MVEINVLNKQVLNVFRGDQNNSIQVSLGDPLDENSESTGVQWIQHSGFASIPPKAVPGQSGCETVTIEGSQRDTVIASRDVASQGNYGKLTYGEFCMYSAGADGQSQGRVMGKGDGSVTLYTTDDNTAAGTAVYQRISPTAWEFVSPFGKMVFDESGWYVRTKNGGEIRIMNVLNLANPLASSSVRISAGNVLIDSGTIFLGPTTGGLYLGATYDPLPATSSPATPALPGTVIQSTSVFIGV